MSVQYPITNELDTLIDLKQKTGVIPHYTTLHSSVIVFNTLLCPRGVAIEETTHHIFVATRYSGIKVFSEVGEFLYQLGVGQLSEPYGITLHGDSIYVSCRDHTVSRFSFIDMRLVRTIGGKGSNDGQFNYPRQLTTDPIGRVFIADTFNNRICLHDPKLSHLRNITQQTLLSPWDVKVSRDSLYVLCRNKNPCMLVLTLEGNNLLSLISCGEGMNVLCPLFFCLDSHDNIIISDLGSHSICVYSPEGNLLHGIGRDQQRTFNLLQGVAIIPNGKLICASTTTNDALRILC